MSNNMSNVPYAYPTTAQMSAAAVRFLVWVAFMIVLYLRWETAGALTCRD